MSFKHDEVIALCVLAADLMAHYEDKNGMGSAPAEVYALTHAVQDLAKLI